jgi:uncharacterized protein
MKKIFLFLINAYQYFFSFCIKSTLGVSSSCRYNPTCSQYAKMTITQYGVIKGGFLALIRVLSCQPISLEKPKSKIRYYYLKVKNLDK